MQPWEDATEAAALLALAVSLMLAIKSIRDFSHTGPHLRDEIARHFLPGLAISLIRLMAWTWLLVFVLAFAGVVVLLALASIAGFIPGAWLFFGSAGLGILLITIYRFCSHLLYLPASIEASSNYRISRFHGLWRWLSPRRLMMARWLLFFFPAVLIVVAAFVAAERGDFGDAAILLGVSLLAVGVVCLAQASEPQVVLAKATKGCRPNILMIGSDTLRADRVSGNYPRKLTPFIDALAKQGALFRKCYVPCARTAPSLASLLTGTWPQHHGIRDNFVSEQEALMRSAPSMVKCLRDEGYQTTAISDWCGADLGKLDFGFDVCDLPEDQWNIRYLLRQGPKDLRLFLTLFACNRLGKRLLPEIYYLATIPTTADLGRASRKLISEAARTGKPFLLNVFMSTTHGPFGSEYPYYTKFTSPDYAGDSKFVMGGLNEPVEVVRKQGWGKDRFDLEQIQNLYDGCVMNFDAEVGKIISHLRECGLEDNTIVVIYSDHGMEFFEHETWGQGNSVLADDSSRIPLVMVGPGIPKCEDVVAVVRTIDIAPTLLELVGIAPDSGMDGVSMLPMLKKVVLEDERIAYLETGIWFTRMPGMDEDHLSYPDLPDLLAVPDKRVGTIALDPSRVDEILHAKDRAVIRGQWKLARLALKSGPRYLLFDMQTDPGCRCDLARVHPDIVENLKAESAALWDS